MGNNFEQWQDWNRKREVESARAQVDNPSLNLNDIQQNAPNVWERMLYAREAFSGEELAAANTEKALRYYAMPPSERAQNVHLIDKPEPNYAKALALTVGGAIPEAIVSSNEAINEKLKSLGRGTLYKRYAQERAALNSVPKGVDQAAYLSQFDAAEDARIAQPYDKLDPRSHMVGLPAATQAALKRHWLRTSKQNIEEAKRVLPDTFGYKAATYQRAASDFGPEDKNKFLTRPFKALAHAAYGEGNIHERLKRGLEKNRPHRGDFNATQAFGLDVARGLTQLIPAIANPAIGISLFAGMAYSEGVDQAKQMGIYETPTGDTLALAYGLIETATERVGLDLLMNRVPPRIRNNAMRRVTDILLGGVIEGTEEGLSLAGKEMFKAMSTHESPIWDNVTYEMGVGAAVGAIMRSVLGVRRFELAFIDEGISGTGDEQQLIGRLMEYAKGPLKSNSRTFYEDLTEAMTSQAGKDTFYIPVEAIKEIEAEGIDVSGITSRESDGDLYIIPAADFLSMPDALLDATRKHIKLTPEFFTQAEAKIEVQKRKKLIEDLTRRADVELFNSDVAGRYLDEWTQQLSKEANWPLTHAVKHAKLIENGLVTLAVRSNMSVEETAHLWNLTFGPLARGEASGQTYLETRSGQFTTPRLEADEGMLERSLTAGGVTQNYIAARVTPTMAVQLLQEMDKQVDAFAEPEPEYSAQPITSERLGQETIPLFSGSFVGDSFVPSGVLNRQMIRDLITSGAESIPILLNTGEVAAPDVLSGDYLTLGTGQLSHAHNVVDPESSYVPLQRTVDTDTALKALAGKDEKRTFREASAQMPLLESPMFARYASLVKDPNLKVLIEDLMRTMMFDNLKAQMHDRYSTNADNYVWVSITDDGVAEVTLTLDLREHHVDDLMDAVGNWMEVFGLQTLSLRAPQEEAPKGLPPEFGSPLPTVEFVSDQNLVELGLRDRVRRIIGETGTVSVAPYSSNSLIVMYTGDPADTQAYDAFLAATDKAGELFPNSSGRQSRSWTLSLDGREGTIDVRTLIKPDNSRNLSVRSSRADAISGMASAVMRGVYYGNAEDIDYKQSSASKSYGQEYAEGQEGNDRNTRKAYRSLAKDLERIFTVLPYSLEYDSGDRLMDRKAKFALNQAVTVKRTPRNTGNPMHALTDIQIEGERATVGELYNTLVKIVGTEKSSRHSPDAFLNNQGWTAMAAMFPNPYARWAAATVTRGYHPSHGEMDSDFEGFRTTLLPIEAIKTGNDELDTGLPEIKEGLHDLKPIEWMPNLLSKLETSLLSIELPQWTPVGEQVKKSTLKGFTIKLGTKDLSTHKATGNQQETLRSARLALRKQQHNLTPEQARAATIEWDIGQEGGKAPSKEVLAALKKTGRIDPEEMEWSMVEDYLETHDKVSREELVIELRNNLPRPYKVRLAQGGPSRGLGEVYDQPVNHYDSRSYEVYVENYRESYREHSDLLALAGTDFETVYDQASSDAYDHLAEQYREEISSATDEDGEVDTDELTAEALSFYESDDVDQEFIDAYLEGMGSDGLDAYEDSAESEIENLADYRYQEEPDINYTFENAEDAYVEYVASSGEYMARFPDGDEGTYYDMDDAVEAIQDSMSGSGGTDVFVEQEEPRSEPVHQSYTKNRDDYEEELYMTSHVLTPEFVYDSHFDDPDVLGFVRRTIMRNMTAYAQVEPTPEQLEQERLAAEAPQNGRAMKRTLVNIEHSYEGPYQNASIQMGRFSRGIISLRLQDTEDLLFAKPSEALMAVYEASIEMSKQLPARLRDLEEQMNKMMVSDQFESERDQEVAIEKQADLQQRLENIRVVLDGKDYAEHDANTRNLLKTETDHLADAFSSFALNFERTAYREGNDVKRAFMDFRNYALITANEAATVGADSETVRAFEVIDQAYAAMRATETVKASNRYTRINLAEMRLLEEMQSDIHQFARNAERTQEGVKGGYRATGKRRLLLVKKFNKQVKQARSKLEEMAKLLEGEFHLKGVKDDAPALEKELISRVSAEDATRFASFLKPATEADQAGFFYGDLHLGITHPNLADALSSDEATELFGKLESLADLVIKQDKGGDTYEGGNKKRKRIGTLMNEALQAFKQAHRTKFFYLDGLEVSHSMGGGSYRHISDAPLKDMRAYNLMIKNQLIEWSKTDLPLFSTASAGMVLQQWSESYIELYSRLYDNFIPDTIEELTGVRPTKHYTSRERNSHAGGSVKAVLAYNKVPEADHAAKHAELVKAGEWDALVDKYYEETKVGIWALERTPEIEAKIQNTLTYYERDADTFRGSFTVTDMGERMMRLTEAKNAGTFFHEAGHLFLDLLNLMANQPTASPQLKRDLDAAMTWLGAANYEGIQTEQHEQFARAFMRYLWEGKAPSVELSSYFRFYKGWLRSLYTKAQEFDTELPDDVVSIMDRLLATDRQIDEMQAHHELGNLRESPPTYYRFGEDDDDETAVADEQLTAAVMSDLKLQEQRWWRRELEEETAKAAAELSVTPVYRAVEALRENPIDRDVVKALLNLNRPVVDPNTVDPRFDRIESAAIKLGGISRESALAAGVSPQVWATGRGRRVFTARDGALSIADATAQLADYGYAPSAGEVVGRLVQSLSGDAQYSDQAQPVGAQTYRLPRVLYGLTTPEGGQEPEATAQSLGFDNAQNMLNQIVASGTLNQRSRAVAREQMDKRYGETLSNEDLRKLAKAALHNERKGLRLIREYNALSGNPINRRVMRARASETIGAKKLEGLRPHLYHLAEVKHARAYGEAMGKRDLEKAAEHKYKQLENFYLWKESTAAQKKAETMRKYLMAANKRTYDPRAVDPEYAKAIKDITGSFFYTKSRKREAQATMDSRALWINEQDDVVVGTGFYHVVSPNNERETQAEPVKHFSEMTLDEMQGAYDMVRSLRYAGGQKSLRARQRENEAILDIALHVESLPHKQKAPPREDPDTLWSRFKQGVSELHTAHRKFDNMAREMDGWEEQGPFWQATVRPLLEANNTHLARSIDEHKNLKRLFANYDDLLVTRSGRRTFTLENGSSIELSRGGRISMALNMGNVGNIEALLAEGRFTRGDIDAIIGTLTDQEWDLVQRIWDYVDSFWPEIAAQEKTITGVEPPKVEADAFVTASGKQLRGGYYPLSYDRRLSVKRSGFDVEEAAKMTMQGGSARASTRHGYTNERVGSDGMPVDLSLKVLFRHIDSVVHNLAYRETVRKVDRILAHKSIQGVTQSKLGKDALMSMKRRLVEIAAGHPPPEELGTLESMLRHGRMGLSLGALGYSLRSMLTQPLGAFNAVPELGSANMMRAYIDYAGNRDQWDRLIEEKSVFMRERAMTMDRNISDVKRGLMRNTAWNSIKDNSFVFIAWGDQLVSRPIWAEAYRQGAVRFAERHNDKPAGPQRDEAIEADAIIYADRMVARTQATGLLVDMSAVENRNEFVRAWTVMYSPFSALYNILTEQLSKHKLGQLQTSELVLNAIWLLSIPAILDELVFGDDEDEIEDKLLAVLGSMTTYPMATVMGLREAGSIIQYGQLGKLPAQRLIESPFALVTQVVQGDLDKALLNSTANAASYIFHVPATSQLKRTVNYLIDYNEGDTDAFNPFELVVTGNSKR